MSSPYQDYIERIRNHDRSREERIAQAIREQEQELAISYAPATINTSLREYGLERTSGIRFQTCGGGRRVIRKKLSGD